MLGDGAMGSLRRVYGEIECKTSQWSRLFLAFVLAMVAVGIFPCVLLAETSKDIGNVMAKVAKISSGAGQVCIQYVSYYSSLIDWLNGPVELHQYQNIFYESIGDSWTTHSCAGGSAYPGALQEGTFLLLQGGLPYQAAIVEIEQIEDKCPYMLTYYRLTNAVVFPDLNGTCMKSDKSKNFGPPAICQ